jgi:hypothetical protein
MLANESGGASLERLGRAKPRDHLDDKSHLGLAMGRKQLPERWLAKMHRRLIGLTGHLGPGPPAYWSDGINAFCAAASLRMRPSRQLVLHAQQVQRGLSGFIVEAIRVRIIFPMQGVLSSEHHARDVPGGKPRAEHATVPRALRCSPYTCDRLIACSVPCRAI